MTKCLDDYPRKTVVARWTRSFLRLMYPILSRRNPIRRLHKLAKAKKPAKVDASPLCSNYQIFSAYCKNAEAIYRIYQIK